jgi:L-2-hydroxyglutarate oxidase LhgO
MSAEVDIAIVGAGVIGCAVARELAQAGREIFVLEKNSGITRGENQFSRNSGVIHAGLYYDRSMRPPQGRTLR